MIMAIGFIIGIIYGLYLKTSIVLFIILTINFLLVMTTNKKMFYLIVKRRKIIIMMISCALLSNFYLTMIHNQYDKFYNQIEQKINLEAVILSEKTENEYYNSYIIKSKDKKFILYVKKKEGKNLEYGMKIKISRRLYRARRSKKL